MINSEQKNQLSGEELLTALQRACRGLVYISETDAEVEPVLVSPGKLTINQLVTTRLSSENEPVETSPADDFFERLVADKQWHSDKDKKIVRRYQKLKELLFANLKDIRVIRTGNVRIDIYVLGYDPLGNIAGIHTSAVET